MKKIYVLRHAPYKYPVDDIDPLTNEGKELCLHIKDKLRSFNLVYSSSRPRCSKTAEIISGKIPVHDDRAGALDIPKDAFNALVLKSKSNKYGMAGAAFDTPELREEVITRGNKIISLIKEILQSLPKDGQGLIVTHDAQMVAAEKQLNNESLDEVTYSYNPLEGFIVCEDLHTQKYFHS